MRACLPLDEGGRVAVSSRAKYMALGVLDGTSVAVEKVVENPALNARERRPTFIRACREAGAQVVIAAHGSYCIPSALEARRGRLRLLVGEGRPEDLRLREAGAWEFIYSSLLATFERAKGH
ncbi:hypothetical protein [Acidilobus saccharovorans]|uniref:hypothetical protein n=1 Tax=Acidilobus saccharovorans TaxID=242703 RepID=UPI0006621BAE|nr:hypothetical protein [Acidilobus saccharovorans]